VISLLRLGRVEQAAEALAEADQLLPADGQLLSLLAQAQADAGRCSAALDSVARLEELAAGKKASPEVARFIGQIRERCGGR
jgi:Flp pilus assembly protein TadD